MADKMPDIKKLLIRTDIRATEFASLVGVTPPMVYRWLKGAEAHALRLPKLIKLDLALTEIAKKKGLPLPSNIETKDRLGAIKTLLVNHLRKAS